MVYYIQSKIRGDGATGAKYGFEAKNLRQARKIIRDTIPGLRSFYDAVALVLQGDGEPVLLLRGKDW